MNRFLFKRAFKSLFKNKVFIILMSLLVFVTSLTYTLFESTSSSFKTSYNQVVSDGALHDLVIKENFQVDPADRVDATWDAANPSSNTKEIQIVNSQNQNVDITVSNIDNALLNTNLLDFVIVKDYQKYGIQANSDELRVQVDASSWKNATSTKEQLINDYLNQVKNQFEAKLKQNISQNYIRTLSNIYSNEVMLNEMNSISISSGVSAFKVVKYNENTQVNKMHIYDGTSSFTQALTNDQMVDTLNKLKDPTASYSPVNTSKGYKITAQDNISRVVSVVDASAYEAIVSPTYANSNNKNSISLEQFITLTQKVYPQEDGSVLNFFDALSSDKLLQARYDQNIIWVDSTPYFIIGIGSTPDFMYPIIDEKHPTIDKEHQAIVYVNNRGYERIVDGFRANPTENYISLKFKPGVSSVRKGEIKNQIEAASVSGGTINNISLPKNSFGAGINMVTYYDDPNDQMTLTQERVAFLSKLEGTINTVSYVTTTMLVVLVAVIVAMVFGVLISSNRKSLASLLALGYSKTQIAVSTGIIALIIGAIPAMLGYCAGFGFQYALINSFDDFWTIPTYGHQFSIVSLLVTTVLPTVPLFVMIVGVTFMSLNYSIPSMLNDSVRDNSWIVAKMMAPFTFLGIKTKYSIALVLRNIGKVSLVSLTTIIAAVALMVGVGTFGQGTKAYNSSVAKTNYEYKIDLLSPTVEGGQYNQIVYDNYDHTLKGTTPGHTGLLAEPVYDPINEITMAPKREYPHWHIPSTFEKDYAIPGKYSSTDASKIEGVVDYLKNKIQTKDLLDLAIAGINPWSTARQLMPDNQINIANQNLEEIKAAAKKYDLPFSIAEEIKMLESKLSISFGNTEDEKQTNYYRVANEQPFSQTLADINALSGRLNIASLTVNDYKKLANVQMPRSPQELFLNLIKNDDVAKSVMPYIITYNTIATDQDDELYTYIESSISFNNSVIKMNVAGVNPQTKMYNLSSSEVNSLQNAWNNDQSTIPVLINKYDEEYYKAKVGTLFPAVVNNDVDRDFQTHKQHNINYKVVGIMDSYNDSSFITLKDIADRVVVGGYKNDFPSGFFNGVLSNKQNTPTLSSLPLYSPSGFYFATDSITMGSNYESWLAAAINDPTIWKYKNDIASDSQEFLAKYSSTLLTSIISKVEWQQMDAKTFTSINKLSSMLINIVEAVSIMLSIIFTFIVIGLIIRTNRKRIATLWTIGYRKKEIISIFLSNIIVPIILAFAIASPVSVVLLYGLREFIMHFGHVLIPFSLAAWIPFAVIAGIALVYVISTSVFIWRLSSQSALEAFKGD